MPADFEFVQRHSAAKTDDYHLELDEYRRGDDQLVVVHFRVAKLTPAVMRRMLDEWRLFRSIITCDLYATAQIETPTWHKFVKRFGFTPLIDVLTIAGEPRAMYIHRTHDGQLTTKHTINDQHLAVVGADALSNAGLPGGEQRLGAGPE